MGELVAAKKQLGLKGETANSPTQDLDKLVKILKGYGIGVKPSWTHDENDRLRTILTVNYVKPGSEFQRAGVKIGHVILEINNQIPYDEHVIRDIIGQAEQSAARKGSASLTFRMAPTSKEWNEQKQAYIDRRREALLLMNTPLPKGESRYIHANHKSIREAEKLFPDTNVTLTLRKK